MVDNIPNVIPIPAPLPERPEPVEGLSLKQVISILGAHKWKSLAVALLVIATAAAVTKLMPKTYSAVAMLIVNPDNVDPLAKSELSANLLGSYFATEMELIQAPDVLDEVIRRLKLTDVPEFASGNRGGEATLRDWVETNLRKRLDIEPGRSGSELIYVTASASEPQLPALIANTVVDVYLEQRVARTSQPASKRATRYSRELAELKAKMDQAQASLTQFRSRTGVDLDSKTDVDEDLLSNLEHKLLDARANLNSLRTRANGRTDLSGSAAGTTSEVGALRGELGKLQAHLAELRASYGPKHPAVAQLQSQIDATDAALKNAIANSSTAASSDVSVAEADVRNLERQVEAQRNKVTSSRNYRDLAAKQELELQSAQQVYKKALDGFDEAQFASTSESSTVAIAARARPPVKADKPNPIKYMAVGTALAIVLALALPFLIELPRRRIRCPDDIERATGIPVLVVLQNVPARLPAPGMKPS